MPALLAPALALIPPPAMLGTAPHAVRGECQSADRRLRGDKVLCVVAAAPHELARGKIHEHRQLGRGRRFALQGAARRRDVPGRGVDVEVEAILRASADAACAIVTTIVTTGFNSRLMGGQVA